MLNWLMCILFKWIKCEKKYKVLPLIDYTINNSQIKNNMILLDNLKVAEANPKNIWVCFLASIIINCNNYVNFITINYNYLPVVDCVIFLC